MNTFTQLLSSNSISDFNIINKQEEVIVSLYGNDGSSKSFIGKKFNTDGSPKLNVNYLQDMLQEAVAN
tara:strand:+ start:3510 stop:3713 length:204 start_codon:yes stop_codon:yes gene_type:complete